MSRNRIGSLNTSSSSSSSDGENHETLPSPDVAEERKRKVAERRRRMRAERLRQRQQQQQQEDVEEEDETETERTMTVDTTTAMTEPRNHNTISVDTTPTAMTTPIKRQQQQQTTTTKSTTTTTNSNSNSNSNSNNPLRLLHWCWVRVTNLVRTLISGLVTGIAGTAARFPLLTLIVMVAAAVALMVMGIRTNFELDLDIMEMFTPTTSRATAHRDWAIYNEARYTAMTPLTYITVQVIVHQHGRNVLEIEGMERLFDALEVATSLDRYQELCGTNNNDESTSSVVGSDCEIQSMTRFWKHNRTLFESQISQDSDLYPYLSLDTFPDSTDTVDLDTLLGVHDTTTSPPTAQALFLNLNLPAGRLRNEQTFERFTDDLLEAILPLRDQLDDMNTNYEIEYTANYSIEEEFRTAIFADFPLLPVVLLVMVLFTVSVFWKCHRVESRFLLALGAVVTVFLAMAAGFGIMFILGFPYGVINNVLPFVVVGVGLDDTYIIHGAFTRTDPRKPILDRIQWTFHEVGLSIFMTTATTSLAFGLGCISTIPAIRNLCYYAFPTIMLDFVYQITLFVAIMVLDERRIQANRFDCCFCCVSQLQRSDSSSDSREVPSGGEAAAEEEPTAAVVPATPTRSSPTEGEGEDRDPSSSLFDDERRDRTVRHRNHDAFIYRIGEQGMGWYANQLLRPWVKALVLLGFTAFTGVCILNAFRLEQDFSFFDLLPDYSMTKSYFRAKQSYGGITNDLLFVHFRGLNQSDPAVQDQMLDYIDQIAALDHIEEAPFCWVRDVKLLQTNSSAFLEYYRNNPTTAAILEQNPDVVRFLENQTSVLAGLSSKEIVRTMTSHDRLRLIYRPQVVFNREDDVVNSRCELDIKELNHRDMQAQLDLNRAYNEITKDHPLNQDFDYDPTDYEDDYYHAFLYEDIFHLWDFFETALWELKVTAFTGVTVVSFFGFLFVPHWSAILYIFPLMCILYVDLLGLLHITGLSINVLTYVILVISVGLLVDFIMHMLLRFFEVEGKTKEEKLRNALKSMGTAVLLGGISTFLGTVPLFFSDSYVFRTVCISIFSMVILGMSHGLILLPVLISIFGGCGSEGTSKGKAIARGESEDEHDRDILPSPTNSSASTAMESSPGSPRTPIAVEYIGQGTQANTFDQYEIRTPEQPRQYQQVVDC